ETGAKQLFACELYAQRVLGVPRVVSDNLLNAVFEFIKSPEVCTEYRWEDGAVLIWDNRIVQHRGVFNYGGEARVLHRAVIDESEEYVMNLLNTPFTRLWVAATLAVGVWTASAAETLPKLGITVFQAPSQSVWIPALIQRLELDRKHGFDLVVTQKPSRVAY